MKRYIISILAAAMIFTLVSCDDEIKRDARRTADDVRDGVRDMTDDAERAADDFTDGTMFDTDRNYNVDNYSANADETK